MKEAGQGQWLGPGPPADGRPLLQHQGPPSGAGHLGGRGQPIGPGTHHDNVVFRHQDGLWRGPVTKW